MASLFSMASLALAGSAAAAHPGLKAMRQRNVISTSNANNISDITAASNVTLSPVVVNNTDSAANSLTPQANVTLSYGLNGTDYLNVTVTTSSGAVKLETIESLASVDCSPDSVSLTFANADSLNSAYSEWSTHEELVLVTNNLGDCDTELERGFFLASGFASYEANLTLVASAEKKNVSDIASYLRANFTGVPGTSTSLSPSNAKRDIIVDTGDKTVSAAWDLPSVTLFEYDPYVTATADASVDVSLTLSGYLDFDIWSLSLDALYVDVEASTSADLILAVDVNAAYDNTFSYNASVGYYLVDVPGILTFGPDLVLSVGAEVSAEAAVSVELDLGAGIDAATMHLDLVGDTTSASGWEPTYHANLTLKEEAVIGVRPFVAVTVELGFDILSGLLDLSAGLTPEVSFPTTITLSAEQDVGVADGGNVTVTQPGTDGVCSNGVEVLSEFEFTLDAFVTQFWSTNLYNVTLPIADECYSWA